MYMMKIDDETFDNIILEHLKDAVDTVMSESEYMTHPEDRAYNTHLLPALLTVIKYFSIPDEYDKYVYEVFDNNNDDEQMSFKFNEDDNDHPGFHYTVKGDEE